MAMKPSLQLRLSQHLALTPQLQQSIRLLQLSSLELNQEIEKAMADNPLLDREDDPLAGTLHLRSDGSIEQAGGPAPAQVVLISYNGRAPRKEDRYLDLPISLDALQLVLLNRGFTQASRRQNRGVDSVLYGLNGRIVRVALPRLITQKTQVPSEQLTLVGETGRQTVVRSEMGQNISALADKSLSDRLPGIIVKALARAAVKFTMAEGATLGAQQAAGRDAAPWVGLIVGLLTKGWAVASEEADKRSWQTLPDEIHIARAWVDPGRYAASVQLVGRGGGPTKEAGRTLTLAPGQTSFMIQRVNFRITCHSLTINVGTRPHYAPHDSTTRPKAQRDSVPDCVGETR